MLLLGPSGTGLQVLACRREVYLVVLSGGTKQPLRPVNLLSIIHVETSKCPESFVLCYRLDGNICPVSTSSEVRLYVSFFTPRNPPEPWSVDLHLQHALLVQRSLPWTSFLNPQQAVIFFFSPPRPFLKRRSGTRRLSHVISMRSKSPMWKMRREYCYSA